MGVGGDGTIKMLAQLLHHRPAAGHYPGRLRQRHGARTRHPGRYRCSTDIVVNGAATPIDVIKINDSEICIHLSDLGLNAMLVKEFEQAKTAACGAMERPCFTCCGKSN